MAAARANTGFKTRWQGWAGRFAALQQREKALIAGAALFVILFGGYTFWIEPAQLQSARFRKAIEQQQTEQTQLQEKLAALKAQAGDPDAQDRALLAQLQKELADAERDIRGFDRVLVAPAQAPQLLQTLLARHRGLSLVSLATLPPQPLVAAPERKGAESGKAAAEKPQQPVLPGGNLYKHGIEIKIAGSYHDLLAYVGELENGERKLLWGTMKLAVQKHPVSELTLTVYTLSLEQAWLAV